MQTSFTYANCAWAIVVEKAHDCYKAYNIYSSILIACIYDIHHLSVAIYFLKAVFLLNPVNVRYFKLN